MKSNYKRLGDFIELVDIRNNELAVDTLLGLSISKQFIPSVANTVGTDMKNYKIIKRNQFACSIMQVRRDKKMPVALLKEVDKAIISQAYPVFQVIDENILSPDYLMMWFSREEFDRQATFWAVGGVRGSLEWEDFLDFELPIPPIEEQRAIIAEYKTVTDRIKLNEQINSKLEETAQTLYRNWFEDYEFPDENGRPYKSSGGKMVFNEEFEKEVPEGWEVNSLKDVCAKIGSGSTPRGGKGSYKNVGISLIRSMNVHDFRFKMKELAFIGNEQAEKLKNVEVVQGDILFNITGASVARTCIVPPSILPARVNQHVMIIRSQSDYLQYYLSLLLCQKEAKQKLIGISESGSTREAITKDEMENFEALIPNEVVLNQFDKKLSSIITSIQNNSVENNKLISLQSLLLSKMAGSKAFTKPKAFAV